MTTQSLTSIMSFPDRGPWGSSSWRGNASGRVYKAVFEQLKPHSFCDPMMGSGTSIAVAKEMGIEAYGLDLHAGFNILRDSIVERNGKEVDVCISHPPYGSMVIYSGEVWGTEAHPDDLSRCVDDADFHEKMQAALFNQRRATRNGGYYGALIGDWRRNGIYTSYQAEMIARMPSDELAAVLIKAQFNCVSDSRNYARMKLPRVMHEYLVLWQKKARPVLVLLSNMVGEQSRRMQATWKAIIKTVMQSLGGKATLEQLYAAVAQAAPEKLASNPNWKAKVRQVVNQTETVFERLDRGYWKLV